jgi:tetratricopeptide (TPR) repeat protein
MKKVIFLAATALVAINTFAQTLQDAQKEIDNENYFKAKQMLFKLINDPSAAKTDVAYYLGNAYLKTDDPDSAKVFYKMVVNPDSRYVYSYLANGRLALLAKNKAEAKLNFDRAVQITKSKNANVYYEIGDAYFRPNIIDLPAAISSFESAYNIDGKNTTIMLALGDAYLENSANDNTMGGKAMNKYEMASETNKGLALAWIKIGRLAVRGRIYDQAIDGFNKAIQIDPNYAPAYKELAEAYYLNHNFDKVKPNFEKYLELSPGDVQARTTLASLYFQNKEYDKAIEESNKGLAKDPNNYIFQRIIAFSDYELKRYKEAYEASQRFLNNPNKKMKDIDVIYAARIDAQAGDTAQAIAMFQKALANDSSNCDLLGEFGKVLYMAKRTNEAISQYAYKKAKCGNLSSLEVFYLGRCYVAVNDSVMADSTFSEFIQRNPTSPDGYLNRARVRLRMGKPEDFLALPDYQKYVELTSTDPNKYKKNLTEAFDYVGTYYMVKEKSNEKAKEFFNKTLELDPADEIAIEMMKQIK